MGSVHSVPSPPPPPPKREKTAPQSPAGQLAEQPTPGAPRAGGQPTSLLELGATIGGAAPAAPALRGNRKRVRRIEQPGPFAWNQGRDAGKADAPQPGLGMTDESRGSTAPRSEGEPKPRRLSALEQGLEAYRKSRQDMLDRSGGQHPAPGPLGTVPLQPDPSQNIPLGRMPAGGAPTPLGRVPGGGAAGPLPGIQRVSLTDPGQGAAETPNRPNAPQGTQVAVVPTLARELLRRLGRSVPVPPLVPVPVPQPDGNTQGNMDQAEPLDPLPPFPTDDGLNTTQFPGQDPDRARQDAIPEPEIYPEAEKEDIALISPDDREALRRLTPIIVESRGGIPSEIRTEDGRYILKGSGNRDLDARAVADIEYIEAPKFRQAVWGLVHGGEIETDKNAGEGVTSIAKAGDFEAAREEWRRAVITAGGDPDAIQAVKREDGPTTWTYDAKGGYITLRDHSPQKKYAAEVTYKRTGINNKTGTPKEYTVNIKVRFK